MRCEDATVCPVERVKGFAILLREIAFRAELHAGGRAEADIIRRRQAVRVVLRPFPGAGTPAVFAANDTVNDPRRPIPRRAPIPFHVAIEGEDFALRVEIKIVTVAEAGENEFPLTALRVGAQDVAAGRENADRVAVRVPLARQQLVLLKIAMGRIRLNVRRNLRVVAIHHVDHPVRPGDDAVVAVLAFAGEFLQEGHFIGIETVVMILVHETVKPRAVRAVAVHVEAVVRVAKAHRLMHRRRDRLDPGDFALLGERDAEERLLVVLRRDDQAALGIGGHANP